MSMSVDVVLVSIEEDDWEGVYVDNELELAGHDISNKDWMELIKRHKKFTGSIDYYEVSQEDIENNFGDTLPYSLEDLERYLY